MASIRNGISQGTTKHSIEPPSNFQVVVRVYLDSKIYKKETRLASAGGEYANRIQAAWTFLAISFHLILGFEGFWEVSSVLTLEGPFHTEYPLIAKD